MSSKKGIYGGHDPRDVATYTIPEAAVYLRIPSSTLRQWVKGQPYQTKSQGQKRAKPVIHAPVGQPVGLSFWNLAEAYVLAGIRRRHGVSLQSVRRALDYVQSQLHQDRPLIDQDFLTNGVDLFVEQLEREAATDPAVKALVNASKHGQLAARELLLGTLERVDRDTNGFIKSIYPWAHRLDEPRHVEIDPRRAFGRPVVAGTSIPMESLAERFRAGDLLADIAQDFHLRPDLVEGAMHWEVRDAAA